MKSKAQTWYLISGTLSALLLVFGVITLVLPQFDKISEVSGKITEQTQANNTEKARIDAAAAMKSGEKDTLISQANSAGAAMPNTVDDTGFLSSVQIAQNQAQVGISGVSVDIAKGAASGSMFTYPVHISGSGSYENVKSFIRNIQTSDRLVTLTNVTVTGGSGSSASFTLDGTIYQMGGTLATSPATSTGKSSSSSSSTSD
jgi:Tfp pilus assembly protein PilO